MPEVRISTELAVAAGDLWDAVSRLEGVNYELGPWLRMTRPRGLEGATIVDLEPGRPAGRSWLLLGRLLPVDYDDLCLVEIHPPRRFLERSRMLSIDPWEHERTIDALGAYSCSIGDRLRFELRPHLARLPGVARLATAVVGAIFRHRHRRLAKLYGKPDR
jgi:hypothetical protein